LTNQVEFTGQYRKVIIPAGTRVTVVAVMNNSPQVRQGKDTLIIPAGYADTSALKQTK